MFPAACKYPPFVLVLLLLGMVAGALAQEEWMRGRTRMTALSFVAVVLGGYVLAAGIWLRGADKLALGDNNAAIRQSQAVALVAREYAAAPVYTNYAGRIYYFTGRSDYHMTPFPRSKARNADNADYAQAMAQMLNDLSTHGGVVIYFKDTLAKMQTVEEFAATPGLRVVADYPDAVILAAAKTP